MIAAVLTLANVNLEHTCFMNSFTQQESTADIELQGFFEHKHVPKDSKLTLQIHKVFPLILQIPQLLTKG